MDEQTRSRVKRHLTEMMNRIIERRINDTFDENEIELSNPFGYRLVPLEIWKGSKFERSFVTTLGQGIFEQLGKIIAEGTGARARNQHVTELTVCTWRLEKIESILTKQRQSKRRPNWQQEVQEVLALNNDQYQVVTVTSDLFIERKDGTREYYSFKTVKPNLDQIQNAKRDMLRLVAGDSNNKVYFALPYNPAGEGRPYRTCRHTIPYKLFDMDNDECVLIGAELWNKIGESPDTYTQLLELFEEVGREFAPRIRKEYLGL